MAATATKKVTSPLRQLKATAMPSSVSPMLCTLSSEAFDDPDWIFEPKFDGLRILARFDGKELLLLSRNQKSQNFQFPDIVAALRKSLPRQAIVDGEVVCLDEQGNSSFRLLQQRFHLQNAREVEERMKRFPAYLYLFDVLYADRYDVTPLPLKDRKDILHKLVRWSDRIRWTEFRRQHGLVVFQEACREGHEGIIAKQVNSPYLQARSDWWLKVKCIGRQEFVIGGFTDPERSRVGLGALLVGYYSDDGQRLIYAGKVGTGFTHQALLDLRRRLDKLRQERCPFDDGDLPRGPNVHWVKPRLVAEIAFGEWTQNNLLRQPRFEGLRPDKKPEECRRERPAVDAATKPAIPDQGGTNGRVKGKTRKEHTMAARTASKQASLEEYREKRDFSKTREPGPEVSRSQKATNKPIFVVQEHHASRLHYDFRLEADGVLKSWAVPKEPSMDPAQKRLAVHVEDHPVSYAQFEGEIPEGEYGAGTVEIWDRGTYENLLAEKPQPQTVTEGIESGRLEFVLHGRKLRGKFALIRMQGRSRGKDNWLLIKMKDEFAHPDGATTESSAPKAKTTTKAKKAASRADVKRNGSDKPEQIAITHPDKIMFPDAGITKGQVFDFYERIAPRLLPYLQDRPATLERFPDGLGDAKAPHFWQKNAPDYYPSWIPRAELPTQQGKTVNYVLVNNQETLLYLVNQGTLTFHIWFSRVKDLDRPDFVLFDLDPSQASFQDAVAVARQLHEFLQEEDVEAFVKTSGKSGLHVQVPWTKDGGYDEARAWALQIAERVVEALPGQATVERSKAGRGRRVYVDVMQNARGHHAVPPYVLRAVPGAGVSTPLEWRELTAKLAPAAFTLKTIFSRLAHQKKDPWAGFLQSISKA